MTSLFLSRVRQLTSSPRADESASWFVRELTSNRPLYFRTLWQYRNCIIIIIIIIITSILTVYLVCLVQRLLCGMTNCHVGLHRATPLVKIGMPENRRTLL